MRAADIAAYLPHTLVRHFARPNAEMQHTCTSLSGLVACIDLSGSTALSRTLSEKYDDASEQLNGILNRFFRAICDPTAAAGGDVLKFSGDAVWIWLPHPDDMATVLTSARRYVASLNAESTITAASELDIHAAVEYGEMDLASVGLPEIRMEAEPIGQPIHSIAEGCEQTSPGGLFIGPNLHDQLPEVETRLNTLFSDPAIPADDDFDAALPSHEADALTVSESFDQRVLAAMLPYVPESVVRRLRNDPGGTLQSELRDVTCMFVLIECPDARSNNVEELRSVVSATFSQIREANGTIARMDPYGAGHKVLALFGAPVKHEHDGVNAVFAASRIAAIAGDGVRLRIGLARGQLFCGEVGSARRKEYTVLGDAANRAARLSSAAGDRCILLDETIHTSLSRELNHVPECHDLKGIGDRVTCYRFIDFAERHEVAGPDVIIGQSDLRQSLLAGIEPNDGRTTVINVHGEAGVGKTTLVTSVGPDDIGHRVTYLLCRPVFNREIGHAARRLLLVLAQHRSGSVLSYLRERASGLIDPVWLPLLNDVLKSSLPHTAWTEGLSPELSLAQTQHAYNRLLTALLDRRHSVIVDDYHHADELSRALLVGLAENISDASLSLVLVTRDPLAPEQGIPETTIHLSVAPPALPEWTSHFEERFRSGKQEEEFLHLLASKTGGHPGLITAVIDGAMKRGDINANPVTDRLEVTVGADCPQIPDSLSDVHLARFDALPEQDRQYLKAASAVLGPFSNDLIASLLPEQWRRYAPSTGERLCRSGLLQRHPEDESLQFVDDAFAETVYSCVPASGRQKFHAFLAKTCAGTSASSHILAEHYFRAADYGPAFHYSVAAAIDAARSHSLNLAQLLFKRCDEISRAHTDAVSRDDLAAYLHQHAEFCVATGDFRGSFPVFRRQRQLAIARQQIEPALQAAIGTGHALSKQAKYARAERALTFALADTRIRKYPKLKARAEFILGDVYRRQSRYEAALSMCEQAVETSEQTGDSALMSRCLNNLGLTRWAQGRLSEAATAFEHCLDLEGNRDGYFSRAQTSNNLAIVYWEEGDFLRAQTLMQRAREIFTGLGDRLNEAYVCGNLASLLRISGKLTESRQLFAQADVEFLRRGDRHAHYYTVGNLSDIDIIEGDLSAAEQRVAEAIEFAGEVEDRELEAECLVRLGEITFCRREYSKADRLLDDAARAAEAIGSNEYLLRALIGRARSLIGRRQPSEARTLVDQISDLAREHNAILALSEAGFLLGECHRLEGNEPAARECFQRIIQYAEGQHVFELRLKCAARLLESAGEVAIGARTALDTVAREFANSNSVEHWRRLVSSAYFSFFAETLARVSVRPEPATSHI